MAQHTVVAGQSYWHSPSNSSSLVCPIRLIITLGHVPFVDDTGPGLSYPPAASSLSSYEDLKDDEEEEEERHAKTWCEKNEGCMMSV